MLVQDFACLDPYTQFVPADRIVCEHPGTRLLPLEPAPLVGFWRGCDRRAASCDSPSSREARLDGGGHQIADRLMTAAQVAWPKQSPWQNCAVAGVTRVGRGQCAVRRSGAGRRVAVVGS